MMKVRNTGKVLLIPLLKRTALVVTISLFWGYNMINQKGKFSIGAILLLLIVVYGGFVAVKFISAGFTASQIENDVKEALYLRQGSDFTSEKGEKAIMDILDKKGVIYDGENEDLIVVTINPSNFRVSYYVEYEIDINLIIFKHTKYVTLDKILGR